MFLEYQKKSLSSLTKEISSGQDPVRIVYDFRGIKVIKQKIQAS